MEYGCELITSKDSNSPEVKQEKQKAQNIASELFDSEKGTDVIFVLNGAELRAHRCVLMIRSEYFDRMFSTDTQEKRDGIVEVPDFEPNVFKIMLEFIYKGELSKWKEKLEKYAEELLIIANKYDIKGLMRKCENYIIRNKLVIANVCHLFILADNYNAKKLKEKSAIFIQEHLEVVKGTEGWKNLQQHTTQAAELLEMTSPPSKRLKLSD